MQTVDKLCKSDYYNYNHIITEILIVLLPSNLYTCNLVGRIWTGKSSNKSEMQRCNKPAGNGRNPNHYKKQGYDKDNDTIPL